jgi:predicted DCC family thiol-disulfide oxidoreductase YuxK
MLRALDWFGRLEFVDMTRAGPGELPVPVETAMLGMPMRTGSGRVLVGFTAVRRALAQTPVGALGAWILYLPVVSWAADRAYRRVASSRRRDSGCGIG